MSLTIKLAIVFLLISTLPILGVSYFGFNQTKEVTKFQTMNDLKLAAELAEGQVLIFLDKVKARTADWASDGRVISEVKELSSTFSKERALKLGEYLRTKKLPLDPTIILTDVFDLNGRIIASTNPERIGHTESNIEELEWEYAFSRAKEGSFGQVFSTELIKKEEAGRPKDPLMHFSTPIISSQTGKVVGIMVNHVLGAGLNKLLSGELQVEAGASSGSLGRRETLEIYLVNREMLMMTGSRFVSDAVLGQKVDNAPIRECLQNGKEFSGQYQNYLGDPVWGVSMCPTKDQFWMLVAEINEKEALAGIFKLRQLLLNSTLAVASIAILAAVLFVRRLVGRLSESQKAIEAIGGGNFKTRASVRGGDAIARINLNINKAAESLENMLSKSKESAERFRSIVKNIHDVIAVIDMSGKITYISPSIGKISDFSVDEIMGEAFSRFVSEKDREKAAALFASAIRGNFVDDLDLELIRKDGKIIIVEGSAAPITNNGYATGIQVIFKDVTERKEAEMVLRESEEKYRNLVEKSNDAIVIVEGGLLKFVNQKTLEILGYLMEEVLEKPFPIFVSPAQRAIVVERYKKRVAGEKTTDWYETELVAKGGRIVPMELSASLIQYKGKPASLSIIRDVTERKQAEANRHELDVLKNKFVSIVSHQLRTPLNAVSWNLEMILKKELGDIPSSQENILKTSYGAVKETIARIGDLATALDIEEGRILLEKEKISLCDLVKSVLSQFEIQSKLKNIKVESNDDLGHAMIVADTGKIRAALAKLIDNAIAYTKEDGSIKVTIFEKGDRVRFEIKDSGIGIPESEFPFIFERFHRASNAVLMKPDASGLGLYIAKSFIKEHGGEIGFESHEGRGSIFWFELPIRS